MERQTCCPLVFHVIFPWELHRYLNHLQCNVMGRSCWTPLFQSQSHTHHLLGQVLKLPTQAGLRLGIFTFFNVFVICSWPLSNRVNAVEFSLSHLLSPGLFVTLHVSSDLRCFGQILPRGCWEDACEAQCGLITHSLSGLSESQPQHRVLSQKQHRFHCNQGWAHPDQQGVGIPRNCDHPGRAPFLGILQGCGKEESKSPFAWVKEAVNNFRLVRSWMFPLSTCLPKACLALCHVLWGCLNQPGPSIARFHRQAQRGASTCCSCPTLPQNLCSAPCWS